MTLRIQPLTKVGVRFWYQEKTTASFVQAEGDANLLFGLGRQGLSPFEQQLDGHVPGDRVRLQLPTSQRDCFWAQHLQPLVQIYGSDLLNEDRLEVEIIKVEPAENREVVKALAAGTGCGGHGGCGCGCS